MRYEVPFEPLAKPEENILLLPDEIFFKVVDVEPIPSQIVDFGSINSGSSTEKTTEDMKNYLRLEGDELAQIRIKPLEDVEIEIWQPPTEARYAIANAPGKITIYSKEQHTETYIMADKPFKIRVTNPHGYNLSKSRVVFYGYKYKLEKLEYKPEKYAIVNIYRPLTKA